MNNVIVLSQHTVAKCKGVGIAAAIAARTLGYSPIQCEAIARKARDKYRRGGISAARAVADSRAEAARHARKIEA